MTVQTAAPRTTPFTPEFIKVGDGVTEAVGSDRYAHTVVRVSKSGKTIEYTADDAVALGPVHDREQYDYEYESTPLIEFSDLATRKVFSNARTARWSEKRQGFVPTGGTRRLSAGRHHFYDPHF